MKIGDLAPDFELTSNTGEKIRLSSYVGKKKVILFFYVKDIHRGVLRGKRIQRPLYIHLRKIRINRNKSRF